MRLNAYGAAIIITSITAVATLEGLAIINGLDGKFFASALAVLAFLGGLAVPTKYRR